MIENEKQQNLEQVTPDERRRLQEITEEHHSSPGRYIAIPSFFIMLLGAAALVTPVSTGFFFSALLFWPLGFGLLWFAFKGFTACSNYSQIQLNLEEDLKNGTKETFNTLIQIKRETHGKYGNWHFFTILDKDYEVDVTTYTRFNTGDQVDVSLSEKARVIVGIKKSTADL